VDRLEQEAAEFRRANNIMGTLVVIWVPAEWIPGQAAHI
jgi:hypothetical protein